MNGISPSRIFLFAAVAIGGCAVDLATKSWMFAELGPPGGRTWWLWPEYVGFQTSLNEGALFGMAQGKAWLFAALSIVAGSGIIYWLFVVGAAADRFLTVALGAIMAGVLGNLYDRLGLWWTPEYAGYPKHAVRDFLLVQYENWVWPNFNIADSLLVCGAGLLILHAWLVPNGRPATAHS
jgi:signal peptidase II